MVRLKAMTTIVSSEEIAKIYLKITWSATEDS